MACVACHLEGVVRRAVVCVGAHSLCADHAPPAPKERHLRLVPFVETSHLPTERTP